VTFDTAFKFIIQIKFIKFLLFFFIKNVIIKKYFFYSYQYFQCLVNRNIKKCNPESYGVRMEAIRYGVFGSGFLRFRYPSLTSDIKKNRLQILKIIHNIHSNIDI
jgi:hypothetical protein